MDEIEHKLWKEKVMKCKLIALDSMKHHPLDNIRNFSERERRNIMKLIEANMSLSDSEITDRFNEICNEVLFCSDADLSKYPIYE